MSTVSGMAVWNEAQVKTKILSAFNGTRRVRYFTDKIAVIILSACALCVLVPLFSILIHIVSQGVTSLNMDFLTKLPKSVGEKGGGMANAIFGSGVLLGIAAAIGVPILSLIHI